MLDIDIVYSVYLGGHADKADMSHYVRRCGRWRLTGLERNLRTNLLGYTNCATSRVHLGAIGDSVSDLEPTRPHSIDGVPA